MSNSDIEKSNYPETKSIDRLSSILSFISLKLSSVKRYNADDTWCNDRGNGLLSDTVNIDFTTIPYWGDDSALENNWSGKRGKALAGMLASICQDPDSGIIDYGDSTTRHKNEGAIVLEFLDFYKSNTKDGSLRYLVFDSKIAPYANLAKLDADNIKFVTIRRRYNNLIKEINNLPKSEWRKIRVMNADGKGRILKVNDKKVFIKEYGKELRQLVITGHGKIKPAVLITNDHTITLFNKFINNSGFVSIKNDVITVEMKKKRNLPLILEVMQKYENTKICFFKNKTFKFSGASTS